MKRCRYIAAFMHPGGLAIQCPEPAVPTTGPIELCGDHLAGAVKLFTERLRRVVIEDGVATLAGQPAEVEQQDRVQPGSVAADLLDKAEQGRFTPVEPGSEPC